jgi:bifunctional UDP-N-acetylglucosamine pyrophosphorylase/glucosamine-1-phosphate N-acetyltransferase
MSQPVSHPIAAIILAAGKGTRMRSAKPKVLHGVGGQPMIKHLLATVRALGAVRTVVVVSPDMVGLEQHFDGATVVVQDRALGTGDAARCASDVLAGFDGTVLVLFGADPLVSEATLRSLANAREAGERPALVVLGFRPHDPGQYGRLVVDDAGRLEQIVEYWDATPEQRDIALCNSGVMAVDGEQLFHLLGQLKNDNAKREYYLTDIVRLAREGGLGCAVVEGDANELVGVDDRADLAEAEAVFQRRARAKAMAEGATLVDPDSVWFSFDTVLGKDVVIEPNVFFGPGVRVADGAHIKAFCHLEGCSIAGDAVIGPFARLRPGAVLAEGARVGNFVEIKNAEIGAGAKVNHLTYVGDAIVGEKANIGAGTITANYDGFRKARTEIGANASIGSNVVLVAPVAVGAGATVGAGTVVREDVPADALRVADTRSIEATRAGWSKTKRERAKGDS